MIGMNQINQKQSTYKYFKKLQRGLCPECKDEELKRGISSYICSVCDSEYDYETIDVYLSEQGDEE